MSGNNSGASPADAGPGCQPSASASLRESSRSGIPDADAFARLIRATLAAHPDWLPEAVQGLFSGTLAALAAMNTARAASDAACLAALALCDTKRMSPELRASLLGTITKPMHAPNLCELERKFAASAIEARSGETRSEAEGFDPKGESAVPKGDAQ